ncbi:MAG: DUF58 domain-containing protein [Oceanococcus sp.]
MRKFINRSFENWVAGRHKPQNPPVSIRKGRCYILPTRPGYVFGLMLFAMLLGAMNYSNNLAFALTFLLGGMGMVAMHHTNANLLGIDINIQRIPPVFAGEPIWVPLQFCNRSKKLRYSLLCGLKRGELSPDSAVDCPANDLADSGFEIAAKARGVYRVPRFAVATEFPLGLFQAWSWLTLTNEILVYPSPAKTLRDIPPVASSQGSRSGEQLGSDDFSHLRDYQIGDPQRSIHWKRYGHTGRLTVKTFVEPLDESLWLDWNSLRDLSSTEERLSQLCRWVLDCEALKRPYGLRLPDVLIEPNQGPGHQQQCLALLARHEISSSHE